MQWRRKRRRRVSEFLTLERLPVAYELTDKVKLWGTDTMDPLALRNVDEGSDTDNQIIQTTEEDAQN